VFVYGWRRRRRYKLRMLLAGLFAIAGVLVAIPSAAWGNPSGISSRVTENSVIPSMNVSSSHTAYENFLLSVEALYNAINKDQLDEAQNKLTVIEWKFRSLPMKGITTAEGVQALAQNITELKRTAAAATPDELRWKSGAAALRLSADALAHPEKPIWHQYRAILNEDISRLRLSLEQKTTTSVTIPETSLQEFEQLTLHYRVIRSAVLIKSPPWTVERSDSVLRYVSRILSAKPPNAELLQGIIPPLEEAMDGLFPENKLASTALVPPITAPPWGWTAMMGSFIVTVLTWVGWIRYRVGPNRGSGSISRRSEPKDAAQQLLEKWKK
jgi:sporulation protein YpjB